MRIALINESSQAAKNATIEAALKKAVVPMGHQVDNYGMYGKEGESQLTYVQNGILAAILLNSGAADYVVTGCGTGEGAMLALNSFPGVLCGFGSGNGYPAERAVPEQRNKKILDAVRAHNFKDLIACLKGIDQELVRGAIAGEHFAELFFANAKDEQIIAYVRELLG